MDSIVHFYQSDHPILISEFHRYSISRLFHRSKCGLNGIPNQRNKSSSLTPSSITAAVYSETLSCQSLCKRDWVANPMFCKNYNITFDSDHALNLSVFPVMLLFKKKVVSDVPAPVCAAFWTCSVHLFYLSQLSHLPRCSHGFHPPRPARLSLPSCSSKSPRRDIGSHTNSGATYSLRTGHLSPIRDSNGWKT